MPLEPKIHLDATEQKWVKLKWTEIRLAQKAADKANNEWAVINDGINDYLDRSGITDIVQRANIKGNSIPLGDALGTGSWHARNAERHLMDLQVFLKMRELGVM